IQEAVGGYFKDPTGTSKKVGSDMQGSGQNFVVSKDNMSELKEQLQKAIREVPNIDKLKNHIDMTVTNEGLRVELMESASGTFFESGSSKPNKDGDDILIALAHELGKLPNKIYVEGHTDAKPYSQNSNYTNWELSADRANATRRLIQENGVKPDQVTQVRGFADQSLRKPDAPLDPANRRVSMIVQYLAKKPEEDSPAAKEGGGEAKSVGNQPAKAEH
ncbi:MAG: OmpA family protein, partial [Candidatus Acidiferrales bacterium]